MTIVFFQAEDGIRDLVRSRGLGDVYKRQMFEYLMPLLVTKDFPGTLLSESYKSAVRTQIAYGDKRGVPWGVSESGYSGVDFEKTYHCLLYTSDAADERSSVDLGGRRIIKKKKKKDDGGRSHLIQEQRNTRTQMNRHRRG